MGMPSIIQDIGIWDHFGTLGIFSNFGIFGQHLWQFRYLQYLCQLRPFRENVKNAEEIKDIKNAKDIEDAEIVSISQILDMYGYVRKKLRMAGPILLLSTESVPKDQVGMA